MKPLKILFVLILLGTVVLVSLSIGSVKFSPGDLYDALVHYSDDNQSHYAIMHLRLPRALLVLAVGACLAVSGYLMQTLVNNPLADPYLLGTASGAGLGASLVYSGLLPVGFSILLFSSLAAFIGALLVTLLAIGIAYHRGQLIPSRLLLGGLALSSLMVAFISLLSYLSGDQLQLRTIVFWSMGSFEMARWANLPLPIIVLLASLIFFRFYHKSMHLLLMGEERAQNLGAPIKKLRWIILLSSSMLTAVAVANAGSIGFVGMIIPHVTRAAWGITGPWNLSLTALTGGTFLLLCDLLSRFLYSPTGLPVGIITAFLGIPFFVYLLWKNYRY